VNSQSPPSKLHNREFTGNSRSQNPSPNHEGSAGQGDPYAEAVTEDVSSMVGVGDGGIEGAFDGLSVGKGPRAGNLVGTLLKVASEGNTVGLRERDGLREGDKGNALGLREGRTVGDSCNGGRE
jgi:hypothetical protein